MMTSHGQKQVQLVNKIFCLLFSYSVQFEILKHINATWKTSWSWRSIWKRVFNPLTLCHGIVNIQILVVHFFKEDTTNNTSVTLMLILHLKRIHLFLLSTDKSQFQLPWFIIRINVVFSLTNIIIWDIIGTWRCRRTDERCPGWSDHSQPNQGWALC